MPQTKTVEDFYLTIKNSDRRKELKLHISVYLNWRGKLFEDILQLGNKEIGFFQQFIHNTPSIHYKRSSKNIICSKVRRALIFCGSTIKRHEKKKEPLQYQEDQYMLDFITMSGMKENTKRTASKYLARYCEFRKKTPTELVEEAQQIPKTKLQVLIKQFSDSMTNKSKLIVVGKIIRFYGICADIHNIQIVKDKGSSKRTLLKKQLIDKTMVREMLSVADLRDSMLIMICFESGMNPVDIISINYGDLKEILDINNPAPITDVHVMIHTRQKTHEEFLAGFGVQSLNLIKKWVIHIKKNLEDFDISLTDDFPIFTHKTAPFHRLDSNAISNRLFTISNHAGLKPMRSNDFRNSFNTRIKPYLKHFDKELFMGHLGGIERHYDISTIEYYTEEYRRVWKICFDLSFDDVKTKQLERKVIDIELNNQELQKRVAKQDQILNILYGVIRDKIDKKGIDNALEDLFPEKS